jgi:type I restriction enzyme M protein
LKKVHRHARSGSISSTPDAKSIDQTTFDLSARNPNGGEEIAHRSPEEIMDEIAALDIESAEVVENIQGLLK